MCEARKIFKFYRCTREEVEGYRKNSGGGRGSRRVDRCFIYLFYLFWSCRRVVPNLPTRVCVCACVHVNRRTAFFYESNLHTFLVKLAIRLLISFLTFSTYLHSSACLSVIPRFRLTLLSSLSCFFFSLTLPPITGLRVFSLPSSPSPPFLFASSLLSLSFLSSSFSLPPLLPLLLLLLDLPSLSSYRHFLSLLVVRVFAVAFQFDFFFFLF